MKGRVALVGVWLILSGCSYLTQTVSGFGRISAAEYLDWASGASAIDRQTELSTLQGLSETQSSVPLATKIGLLIKMREEVSAEGDAYALSMLEVLDNDTQAANTERDYLQLGLLVRDLLTQRQALRQAQQTQADVQRQIDTLKSENQLLQSQIEALKNIENQINERQQQENGDETDSN